MLRSLITNAIMLAISALIALVIVKVFDDWHQDCQERRAVKREQRNRNQHNRYE